MYFYTQYNRGIGESKEFYSAVKRVDKKKDDEFLLRRERNKGKTGADENEKSKRPD